MIKVLAKSIREYKAASLLSPLFVTLEVVLECLIPFVIAGLLGVIESGALDMWVIGKYAIVLVAMSILSLLLGALAGDRKSTRLNSSHR